MRSRVTDSGVRLAELMAALSIATDLGMGQPLETALCSCVVAMRLGEALNLDGDALRDVYYQALLRYIGCNSDADALAALMGDELALRHDFAARDLPGPVNIAAAFQRTAGDKQQRIIVVGNGAFLSNTYLGNAGNLQLGIAMVNWLAAEDDLVAIDCAACALAGVEKADRKQPGG